ncbi:MAG: hypothetical protein U0324_11230 [Polyangiales bacterium]
MSESVYRRAPGAPAGPPRRSVNPAGAAAMIACFALSCASPLVGGKLTRGLLAIDQHASNAAFRWAAAASAVAVAVGLVLAAAVRAWRARRKVADAVPDFTPRGAGLAIQAFGALFVAAPIWLLLTLWLALGLSGVAFYLDARDAGPPREATCEVTRCRGYTCVVTCTCLDGARARGSFFRSPETPRRLGVFRVQVRRGRLGSWLLVLASVRYRTTSPEAPPAAPR